MSDTADEHDSLLRAVARAPDKPLPDEERDRRIGTSIRDKYTIDDVLGEGGMAIVYAATHRNRKRFALKVLRRKFSDSIDAQKRFVREGYVANTIEHPGAVAILDDDVAEDGCAFIVMELLEGAPLDRILERTSGGLPCRAVLEIGVQVLDVLAAAHAKGIVHRDIKPQNLFLERDGALKVLDFGIARLREGSSKVETTESGLMIGTPAFMPPEQALGAMEEIDAKSDIWAVGATLFALLSKQVVHEGGSGMQVVVRSATKPARSLGSVAPAVPRAVVTVVDRALAFEKVERWPSAAAMRDALKETYVDLFGEDPSRRPLLALFDPGALSGDTRDSPPVARQRLRTPIMLALIVCAGGIGLLFARPHSESIVPSATPPASLPSTSISIHAERPISSQTPQPTLSASHQSSPHPTIKSSSRPPASAKADCDPPYTLTPTGKRVPKPDCLN